MMAAADIRVREVGPHEDSAALELERRCPQGRAFRIVFERESFRRRTDAFPEARLIGAWHRGQLIAVGGGAIKDVSWEGSETRSLMLYDFRVDPAYRREGVGRLLTETLIEWAKPKAEIGIAYSMGDNRAIQAMAREWIGADSAPAFSLLAYPTFRRSGADDLVVVPAEETRASYLRFRKDAVLQCHACEAFDSDQMIGSFRCASGPAASCSIWTTKDILEEVVVGLPTPLKLASKFFGGSLARRIGMPHVPKIGGTLRSWLVFDGHAADETAARKLFSAIAQKGRAANVDHCHILLPPQSLLPGALWRDVPKVFAPLIPFSIMARELAGRPLLLPGPVVDPRDI
ncbi:GNAT family N-acetyltransferase [Erythrobacter gaetbuli]|uniref:GNAT family N-acetyltransferase n=1 Tax=Qipengyuania gaetbuli TaxID=266952 RepID=A0A844XXQ3_9SPHN|nr:GNAT family N-acetyltransferase [Qipengyuania gaetbuli]MXO49702.1 GNAT family N-acetyltransferase [Qipengyuania gaetbuli]